MAMVSVGDQGIKGAGRNAVKMSLELRRLRKKAAQLWEEYEMFWARYRVARTTNQEKYALWLLQKHRAAWGQFLDLREEIWQVQARLGIPEYVR